LVRGVRLYSKALSGAEVTTLYNGGTFTAGGTATNLVAGYDLTEGTGTSLTDFSGNGHTGTVTNASTTPYLHWLDATRSGGAHTWFATTTGSIANTGVDNTHGWDIRSALAGPPELEPGDTIKLKDSSTFDATASTINVSLVCTALNPCVVRPETLSSFPPAAKIDGTGLTPANGIVTLLPSSRYVAFQGIEVYAANSSRISAQSGSNPTDIPIASGIVNLGNNNAIINNYVHDVNGNGMTDESTPQNSRVEGNIFRNNGWQGPDRGHGHQMYIQSLAGQSKVIKNNYGDNSFGYCVHAFTTVGSLYNLTISGNICNESGRPSQVYGGAGAGLSPNVYVGPAAPANNILVTGNHGYFRSTSGANFLLGGSTQSVRNIDLTLTNNIIVGGQDALSLSNWEAVTMTGNKIYSTGEAFGGVFTTWYRVASVPTSANWTVNTNSYYNQTSLSGGLRFGFKTTNSALNYSTYKTDTGFDATGSSETIGLMPDQVTVTPNTDVSGRAIITVENLSGASSKSVNLSSIGIVSGQGFKIYNLQNPTGAAIVDSTYAGVNITLPLTDTTFVPPTGFTPYSASMTSTAPTKMDFLVIPGAQSIGTAPAAPTLLTVTTPGTSVGIALSWTVNSNTGDSSADTGIKVYYSTDGTTYSQYGSTLAAHTASVVFIPPTPRIHYWVKVQATNGNGDSLFSNIVQDDSPTILGYCGTGNCAR
jgi:hypothetical protein